MNIDFQSLTILKLQDRHPRKLKAQLSTNLILAIFLVYASAEVRTLQNLYYNIYKLPNIFRRGDLYSAPDVRIYFNH